MNSEQQRRIPKSVGGSRPHVQAISQATAENEKVPFLASRIYAPPAQRQGDSEFDPRYPDKDTQVENIYLPSSLPQDKTTRSGVVQIFNWLFTGKMG